MSVFDAVDGAHSKASSMSPFVKKETFRAKSKTVRFFVVSGPSAAGLARRKQLKQFSRNKTSD